MSDFKKILMLGDSRRMGYEPFVREKLMGLAEVFGPKENGRWAGYTLNSLRFWINDFPSPDIVHWSCGLWDLGDDYGLGRPFSLPDEYESAVECTVTVLRKLFPGVIIVFGTTMPVGDQDPADIERYNDIMKRVAQRHGIHVDDLFGLMKDKMKAYDCGDGLHLNDAGNDMVSELIAGTLKKILSGEDHILGDNIAIKYRK